MSWSRHYALLSYIRASLWIVPFIAFLVFFVSIRVLDDVDDWLAWSWTWKLEVSQAQAGLSTIITLTLSFMVFTFGSLLVAIQVASANLTPRIIATTLLRDNAIRSIVGLFVLTLLFCTGTLIRISSTVPYLLLTICLVLGHISIVAFLYLIDYAARLLRPSSIVRLVSKKGLTVIESVYPDAIEQPYVRRLPTKPPETPDRTIAHAGTSAIVLALNTGALVAEAQRHNIMIEFVHQVGDFVAKGEPLFRLYGKAAAVDERRLCDAVAFGPERTIEQDATFALRVIVDIAIRALSKAINDPTTAVLAIDQLQRLLSVVGRRHLHDNAVRDANGAVRLILPTPNWPDFVHLACREIRLYGAENLQVARRLRAMLLTLIRAMPQSRQEELTQELALLDRTIETTYALPEDAALAKVADLQGLGGASRH